MQPTYDGVADPESCYRAVQSRDRRFDGVFYTAVRTTGIYCRPSCPAVTPRRENTAFFATAAGAQAAGYRSCRRCRPDLTPGSPEWDVKGDVAGRAMRMIADGLVEREGVGGLAARCGYTRRHVGRVLTEQLGAGPLALARAHRAHTARILIETSRLGFADIAFAAGFSSVRQFNATVREVYAASPTQLRASSRRLSDSLPNGHLTVSLPVREPFDSDSLLGFLRARTVEGVETMIDGGYARTLRLPHGAATVALLPKAARVECRMTFADLRDLSPAVERCRRLFDLDADPVAIDGQLLNDELLGPWVRKRPGLRAPGHVDGFEVAVRAIVGQQVSVSAARTALSRLVSRFGERLEHAEPLSRLFPTPAALAAVDPANLPMPRNRGRALVGLAAAVAAGDVVLDRSADRASVRASLLALTGVGPWTADYIALRALGDPDIFLYADLGVRKGLAAMCVEGKSHSAEVTQRWRPWRSYALMHVWAAHQDGSDRS